MVGELQDGEGTPGAPQDTPVAPRHILGRWHALSLALSGIVGSGWLLAIPQAATIGLYSIGSWCIAALALGVTAMMIIQLAVTRTPHSGSLIRWPMDTSGRAVGTIVGAGLLVVYSANAAGESAAVVQVLGSAPLGLPGLVSAGVLTWNAGRPLALAVMTVLFAINWFGLPWVARMNTAITSVKLLVPLLTVIVIAVGFFSWQHLLSWQNINHLSAQTYPNQQNAPLGNVNPIVAMLGTITTMGMVFSYTGFQGPVDHAEDVDPRRMRLAVGGGLAISALMYMALQLVFLGAITPSARSQVTYFYQLPLNVPGLHWLSAVLFADSMLSPLATSLVFISFTSVTLRAASAQGLLRIPIPRNVGDLSQTFGPRKVPRIALGVNFLVGSILLLFLPDWANISTVTGVIMLFVYSYTAISYTVFRKTSGPTERAAKYPKSLAVIAPISFAISTSLMYYAGWSNIWKSYSILFSLAILMFLQRLFSNDPRLWEHVRRALWLIGYFLVVLALSALSQKSGIPWLWEPGIPPWIGGVVAAAIGVAGYYVGVRQALKLGLTK